MNFFENSIISNQAEGIKIMSFSYNTLIVCNNITGNNDGIFLHDAARFIIFHNTISQNNRGLALYGSPAGIRFMKLRIRYNDIINNTIGLWHWILCNKSQIIKNNFIHNELQVQGEAIHHLMEQGISLMWKLLERL